MNENHFDAQTNQWIRAIISKKKYFVYFISKNQRKWSIGYTRWEKKDVLK